MLEFTSLKMYYLMNSDFHVFNSINLYHLISPSIVYVLLSFISPNVPSTTSHPSNSLIWLSVGVQVPIGLEISTSPTKIGCTQAFTPSSDSFHDSGQHIASVAPHSDTSSRNFNLDQSTCQPIASTTPHYDTSSRAFPLISIHYILWVSVP